jgi:hypothetical protein
MVTEAKMNGQDQRGEYINSYRRQLRQETQIMGTGRKERQAPDGNRESGNPQKSRPIRQKTRPGLGERISGWADALALLIADKIIGPGDEPPASAGETGPVTRIAHKSIGVKVIDAIIYPNYCQNCPGRTTASACWWCRGGRLPGLW